MRERIHDFTSVAARPSQSTLAAAMGVRSMGDWNRPLAHVAYSPEIDDQFSGAPAPMYPQAWGAIPATGSATGLFVCDGLQANIKIRAIETE
jgi:hypothetical protein